VDAIENKCLNRINMMMKKQIKKESSLVCIPTVFVILMSC